MACYRLSLERERILSLELPVVAVVVEGRVRSIAVVAVPRETVCVPLSDLCTLISTRLRFGAQSYRYISLFLAFHIHEDSTL